MIQEIPLSPVPNQNLIVPIDGRFYTIEITSRRNLLYITADIDGVNIMRNRALLSYAPLPGDLMLADTAGTDDPQCEQLGARFQLMYWP